MRVKAGIPPTDIRVSRGDVVLDQIPLTNATGKRIGSADAYRVQSRLERMAKRKEILEREHTAGKRFADDAEAAMVSTRSCLALAGLGDPVEAAIQNGSRSARAAVRLRKAVDAMGDCLAGMVVWVAIEGKPCSEWAYAHDLRPRDGIAILRLGLQRLAEHYGLDSDCHSPVQNSQS